jgi:hypothetical protein
VCGGISTAIDRRAEDIQEVVATLRTMATNHDTTDEGARQRIEGAGR